jgi:enoyl-CoA hydratase
MEGKYKYLSGTLREDGIMVVTMNRPKANALGTELLNELESAFSEFTRRDEVLGVLLRSALATIFSAGLDLGELNAIFAGKNAYQDTKTFMFKTLANALYGAMKCPKPVATAVNGHALAGGMFVALAADFTALGTGNQRDGGEGGGGGGTKRDIKMGLTELQLGIPFPFHPLELCIKKLPRNTARHLVFDAPIYTTPKMFELGVGDCLVDDPEAAAIAWLQTRIPHTLAFGMTKKLFWNSLLSADPTEEETHQWLSDLLKLMAAKSKL